MNAVDPGADRPQEIIRVVRDGGQLTDAQIERMVRGLVDDSITEGQAAAFAMAVFFRGLSTAELVTLTQAMMGSGRVMNWEGLDAPVVDKHSTGGVGDTVSLMLAPIVAACGVHVPMISGRGLGHTGGTMDKMAAIPGYQVTPDPVLFDRVVREVGCAIIGQTADLAPADGRLYAIRDVTATVESIPLITASILSKKLAAGLGGLVMDVKYGGGAFMVQRPAAEALAAMLVEVAQGAGLPTRALLTDMSEPLGSSAGNALEVRYALDYLTGVRREPRMHAVVMDLAAAMLQVAGVASEHGRARQMAEAALADPAPEVWARMVRALGGPSDLLEHPDRYLPVGPVRREVMASTPGRVAAIDCRGVGLAVVALGGGRTRPTDTVDPAVGVSDLVACGDVVGPDRPLGVVWAADEEHAEIAADSLRHCVQVEHG